MSPHRQPRIKTRAAATLAAPCQSSVAPLASRRKVLRKSAIVKRSKYWSKQWKMSGRPRQSFRKSSMWWRSAIVSWGKRTRQCRTSTWSSTTKTTSCRSCSTRCNSGCSRPRRAMGVSRVISQNWHPSSISWPKGFPAAQKCRELRETCRSSTRLRSKRYRWAWRKWRKSWVTRMKRWDTIRTWLVKQRRIMKNVIAPSPIKRRNSCRKRKKVND